MDVAETAEVGPRLSPSVAASSTTVTVTSVSPLGVNVSVYSFRLKDCKVPLVPPSTVISSIVKSEMDSSNVKTAASSAVL